ncbi:MAG: hypothetical protein WAW31_14100, partial [Smithella sp.]
MILKISQSLRSFEMTRLILKLSTNLKNSKLETRLMEMAHLRNNYSISGLDYDIRYVSINYFVIIG